MLRSLDDVKRAAEVMLAAAVDDAVIQRRPWNRRIDEYPWKDVPKSVEHSWDWSIYDYRVKPEPLEVWAVRGESGANYCFWTRQDAQGFIDRYSGTLVRLVEAEVVEA